MNHGFAKVIRPSFTIGGSMRRAMSTTVDRIFEHVSKLPEPLAREVLDFIGYLEVRHGLSDPLTEDLMSAQESAMQHVWDNPDDEIWNDL